LLVALFTLCATPTTRELTVKIESDDWSFQMLANRHGISADHSLEPNGILDNARLCGCVIGTNSWVIEAEPGNSSKTSRDDLFTGTTSSRITCSCQACHAAHPQPGTAIGTYPPGGERWTRVWSPRMEIPAAPTRPTSCRVWRKPAGCLLFRLLSKTGRPKIPPPMTCGGVSLRSERLPRPTTVFHDALVCRGASNNSPIPTKPLQYQVHSQPTVRLEILCRFTGPIQPSAPMVAGAFDRQGPGDLDRSREKNRDPATLSIIAKWTLPLRSATVSTTSRSTWNGKAHRYIARTAISLAPHPF